MVESEAPQSDTAVDVVVLGGGPAGLGAALSLGRMRHGVLVVDSGRARNHSALAVHGYPGSNGIAPAALRTEMRTELEEYPRVRIHEGEAVDLTRVGHGLSVLLDDGTQVTARRLLFATGVEDELPDTQGVWELWGTRVFGCVYCHGWEQRDRPLAVCASGNPATAVTMAVHLRQLSRQVAIYAEAELTDAQIALLHKCGIPALSRAKLLAVRECEDRLRLDFADGRERGCAAMFMITGKRPRSELAVRLGCELAEDGRITTNQFFHSTARRVYAAGDVAKTRSVAAQVILAAAEGSQAGIAIDQDLLLERIRAHSAPEER